MIKNLLTSDIYKLSPRLSIIYLPQIPIYRQLLFEEALYRLSQSNCNAWLIFNDFTQKPSPRIGANPRKHFYEVQNGTSIVLGISARKPEELVNKETVENDKIELIRRFTGGGTVVISPSSMFVISMIFPRKFFGTDVFPKDVMEWTGRFYKTIFSPWMGREFQCRENDYTIESVDGSIKRKFGGNAQALSRYFIVHHTSFLWTAEYNLMHRYLLLPKRQPEYREKKRHDDFVCGLDCEQFGLRGKFESPQEIMALVSDSMTKECKTKGLKGETWMLLIVLLNAKVKHAEIVDIFGILALAQTLEWELISEDSLDLIETFQSKLTNLRTTWRIDLDGKPIDESDFPNTGPSLISK